MEGKPHRIDDTMGHMEKYLYIENNGDLKTTSEYGEVPTEVSFLWVILELPRDDLAARQEEKRLLRILWTRKAEESDSSRTVEGMLDVLWERHGFVPEKYLVTPVPILKEVEGDSAGSQVVESNVINVIANEYFLFTSSQNFDLLSQLEHRAVSTKGPSLTVGLVVRRLLGFSLEEAADFTDSVTDWTAQLESKIYTSPDANWVNDIYTLRAQIANGRRQLLPLANRLRQYTAPDASPGNLIRNEPDERLGQGSGLEPYSRLLRGFNAELEDLDNSARLLADLLTAQFTLVQIQQNSDMRKISAYAALVAVPTLIAGIYGMNFEKIPELGWIYGYPFTIFVMVSVVLVLRYAFKRSGWL